MSMLKGAARKIKKRNMSHTIYYYYYYYYYTQTPNYYTSNHMIKKPPNMNTLPKETI
jgi:hypothetical protein